MIALIHSLIAVWSMVFGQIDYLVTQPPEQPSTETIALAPETHPTTTSTEAGQSDVFPIPPSTEQVVTTSTLKPTRDHAQPSQTLPIVVPQPSQVNTQKASISRDHSTTGTTASVTTPAELVIRGTVADVSERNSFTLSAILLMENGSEIDVTNQVAWEVLGPIGSVNAGVFSAKLEPSIAEFGHAPGALTAKFTDPSTGAEFTAETSIFEVRAYVPELMNSQGQ